MTARKSVVVTGRRCDHAARRGRRLVLGRAAGRTLRGARPDRGLGRASCRSGSPRASRWSRRAHLKPVEMPPAGPLGAVRADRRPRGLEGRRASRASPPSPNRLGVMVGSGIGGVTTLLERLRRPAQGEGPARGRPAHRPDAHAELPGGLRRPGVRRPRRRARAGLGLRHRRRGGRPRHRDDPLRPRRRGGGRRHRGRHPPAADRGLRQHDGDVQAQRRPAARLPALRRRPRRLRAGRGLRHPGPGVGRARRRARRPGLRRGRRRRLLRGLPRHRPARAGRPRRRRGAGLRAGGRRPDRPATSGT